MSTLSKWRVAARLARRETVRRPGRTVLVALLIAVPVAGMTVGNVLSRTTDGTWSNEFAYTYGTADLALATDARTATDRTANLGQLLDERLAATLPAGSTWQTELGLWGVAIRTSTRSVQGHFLDVDLGGPIRQRVIELTRGTAPANGHEVALDARSADAFGVDIGDELVLEHPRGTWTVTGIARMSMYFSEPLFVTRHFDWTRSASPPYVSSSIVLAPDASTTIAEAALRAEFGNDAVVSPAMRPYVAPETSLPTAAVAWGWVFGAVALAVLGVIVAAAFATSARRQLVALGQLSANGADPSLLRLTLALQGTWSGVVGVATGMLLALVGLVGARPVIEAIANRRLPPYDAVASDLLMVATIGVAAATIAALVPARSAARVPVMTALGGRRPLGRVPRRLVLIGLVCFAAGLLLLVVTVVGEANNQGESSDLLALVAVLGGLFVLAAVVCTAPLTVDAVGRVCAYLPGAWRLGGRSLARTRARSAGVVAAIAAMTALVVAGTTMWATAWQQEFTPGRWMPANAVAISACSYPQDEPTGTAMIDPPPVRCVPPEASLLASVLAIVGDADTHTVRSVDWDPAPFDSMSAPPPELLLDGRITVADPYLLDQVGLSSADIGRLESTGAIRLVDEFSERTRPLAAVIKTQEGRQLKLEVATNTEPFLSMVNTSGLLITPARAADLGLPITGYATLLTMPSPLTRDQAERLGALGGGYSIADTFDITPEDQITQEIGFSSLAYETPRSDNGLLIQTAISIVATLLTLIVVAIGLSLSAIESRDERDVLAAMGAPPRVLRSVAARKALIMSAAGAVVALPAGLVPVLVVLAAEDSTGNSVGAVAIPWLTLGALIFGVPLVASSSTSVASAIAQRVRPTTMSTLRAD